MNKTTTMAVWADDRDRIARIGKRLAERRGLLGEVHNADKIRMILDYAEQEMGKEGGKNKS